MEREMVLGSNAPSEEASEAGMSCPLCGGSVPTGRDNCPVCRAHDDRPSLGVPHPFRQSFEYGNQKYQYAGLVVAAVPAPARGTAQAKGEAALRMFLDTTSGYTAHPLNGLSDTRPPHVQEDWGDLDDVVDVTAEQAATVIDATIESPAAFDSDSRQALVVGENGQPLPPEQTAALPDEHPDLWLVSALAFGQATDVEPESDEAVFDRLSDEQKRRQLTCADSSVTKTHKFLELEELPNGNTAEVWQCTECGQKQFVNQHK
jgi:hypothetical protein